MGVASITPALPDMAHDLGLNKTQVGLLISVFAFPGIILSPLTGILADWFGRKTVVLPSLILFAISGFAIFFVRDFGAILVLRVIQGIGAAPLGSLNTTLIGDFFKGRSLPEAMGYNASVLSLSTALYPLIGGLLAGLGWYFPFVIPLLAIPVAVFTIYFIPEPRVEAVKDYRTYFKGILQTLRKREVMAVLILAVLTFRYSYAISVD